MARALWTGSITFGLVNIPVKLYRATAARAGGEIHFHLLHDKCGTRIQQKRWCPFDEEEVPWEHVVKGYEVSKGRYVRVDPAELDEILPKEDWASISIDTFVGLDEVDPLYYDRAYYVAPEGSPKAYALLHHVLARSGRVAIAKVTLRTRSHLAVVRARADRLLLSTMFFGDEIVDARDVPGLPTGKAAHLDKRQEEMAEKLLDSMTGHFEPQRYHDEYAEQVKALVQEKIEKGKVEEAHPAMAEEGGRVIDLMEALKRSLQHGGQAASAPPSGNGHAAEPARPRARAAKKRAPAHRKTTHRRAG